MLDLNWPETDIVNHIAQYFSSLNEKNFFNFND